MAAAPGKPALADHRTGGRPGAGEQKPPLSAADSPLVVAPTMPRPAVSVPPAEALVPPVTIQPLAEAACEGQRPACSWREFPRTDVCPARLLRPLLFAARALLPPFLQFGLPTGFTSRVGPRGTLSRTSATLATTAYSPAISPTRHLVTTYLPVFPRIGPE